MFNAPYFDAGYWPAPYFPKPVPQTGGDYYPATYFGAPNAPGDFWIIGTGGPGPTPVKPTDGGGGGWDYVKTQRIQRLAAERRELILSEDGEAFQIIKKFLREIQ